MEFVFNREKREIVCKDGSVSLHISESDLYEMYKKVEGELYYRSDIEDYFNEETETYDSKAVLSDEALINDMIDYYTEKRFGCDTGDPELLQTLQCFSLNDTIEAFESELRKYKTEKTNIDLSNSVSEGDEVLPLDDETVNVILTLTDDIYEEFAKRSGLIDDINMTFDELINNTDATLNVYVNFNVKKVSASVTLESDEFGWKDYELKLSKKEIEDVAKATDRILAKDGLSLAYYLERK